VTDLFLGIIAVSVLVMATTQVAAIVFAARAARSVGEAVERLEQDVKPIVANLQAISADAVRAAASATAQIERAQKTVDGMLNRVDAAAQRVERTLQALQDGIMAPAREGFAFLQALRSIFSSGASSGPRPSRGPSRPRNSTTDDEDALFIG
jgi:hypothetical protein